MVSIDRMQEILEGLIDTLPEALFRELNGGVILLPNMKRNHRVPANDLYVLGEYHRGGNMGRYIAIYYGSFRRVYGHLDEERLAERLLHTLKHEFTHHLESLAGERGLEIEDEAFLRAYLEKKREKFSGAPDESGGNHRKDP